MDRVLAALVALVALVARAAAAVVEIAVRTARDAPNVGVTAKGHLLDTLIDNKSAQLISHAILGAVVSAAATETEKDALTGTFFPFFGSKPVLC